MPAPQALFYTIGQTHKFRVRVSEYNLTGKTKSITVTKVLSSSVLPPIAAPVESDVCASSKGCGDLADEENESTSNTHVSQKANRAAG